MNDSSLYLTKVEPEIFVTFNFSGLMGYPISAEKVLLYRVKGKNYCQLVFCPITVRFSPENGLYVCFYSLQENTYIAHSYTVKNLNLMTKLAKNLFFLLFFIKHWIIKFFMFFFSQMMYFYVYIFLVLLWFW